MSKKSTVIIATVICALSVIAMITAIAVVSSIEEPEFVPPSFDEMAVNGTPDSPGDSWTPIYREGMSFSAHLCGKVIVSGNTADVYFTNDEGNDVWLKLRIVDSEGNVIAETGIIKPGQYIKSVTFSTVPDTGDKISMKIMAYQPETYFSEGAVSLSTKIS